MINTQETAYFNYICPDKRPLGDAIQVDLIRKNVRKILSDVGGGVAGMYGGDLTPASSGKRQEVPECK